MKQLIQNMKSGEFSMIEAPLPSRPAGHVLVQTRRSLISAGTERGTVKAAQASLLGKARQKPEKVKQVLENVKKEGLAATYKKVQEKLDEPITLGYSSAGVVREVDPDETRLKVGDRVACGGQNFASHAEVVIVPRNLVVKVPDEVSLEEASFGTVGAIAMQGVRRAKVGLGDRVLVIGLGLLGQVTWQLLRGAGAIPIGTDVSADTVALARKLGLEHAGQRGADDIEALCRRLTGGHGVDSVIITAATTSNDPIELSIAALRERGTLCLVGAVPMHFERDVFYQKELDFVISRSYGPGRYDPDYEEKGHDYPYAHVRWTEGRNIQSVLESIEAGSLDVKSLITHRFAFDDAIDAYDIVSGIKPEPHIGIVLEYPADVSNERIITVGGSKPRAHGSDALGIGFIGAGSFARSYLLPHVKERDGVNLAGVVTSRGFTATEIAKKFGFAKAATDTDALLADDSVDAVFVTTRHDKHAELVGKALRAGKHVFVEKPLCIRAEELAELAPRARKSDRILQVGFNRRFSPLAEAVRALIENSGEPTQITYRVNAGPLPADHWLNDPAVGGGRMIGEGCHFIDLMQYLAGDLPVRVSASRFGRDAEGCFNVLVEMAGGSVGTLVYQANAPKAIAKEYLEAFAGGRGGIIHDWRKVTLWEGAKSRFIKAKGQAKGYREEVDAFLKAVRTGKPAISVESQLATTAATFAANRAVVERAVVSI